MRLRKKTGTYVKFLWCASVAASPRRCIRWTSQPRMAGATEKKQREPRPAGAGLPLPLPMRRSAARYVRSAHLTMARYRTALRGTTRPPSSLIRRSDACVRVLP
jgi:hypothetical protein